MPSRRRDGDDHDDDEVAEKDHVSRVAGTVTIVDGSSTPKPFLLLAILATSRLNIALSKSLPSPHCRRTLYWEAVMPA
nr:hypothetical protein CFP56_16584 [Quercus suber]